MDKQGKGNVKNSYLVHLSTVDGSKISDPSWVNIQSAGWVNFQSARTFFPEDDKGATLAMLSATTARAHLRDALEAMSPAPRNKLTANKHYRFGQFLVPPFDVSLQIDVDGLTIEQFREDSPGVMARLERFVIEAIGSMAASEGGAK